MKKNHHINYPANTDIIQSFVNIQESYPPLFDSYIDYPTVKAWLKQIRTEGFDHSMITEIIAYIYRLKNTNREAEASLLLLVSASTEDKDALYVLARELFKGTLFQTNYAAAFGIFTSLCKRGHPQATCDVALFYKNGIIVEKDKQRATKLYQIAMNAGVSRAQKHYNTLMNR